MKIHPREAWNAAPPKRQARISMPTKELWLHHTAGNSSESVRSIQAFHMAPPPRGRGWSDIAYSFLVDQSGTVHVGRGAGVAGGHTKDRNTISHAICAIGNFETVEPSDELVDSIAWLVAHGLLMGWWSSPITGPHKEAPGASTACCGAKLIAKIPTINAKATAVLDQLAKDPALDDLSLAAETPVVASRWDPPFDIHSVVDDLVCPEGGVWVLSRDGGVFAFGGAPFLGSAPKIAEHWGDRRAARLERHPAGGYTIVADTGERYDFVSSTV